ncbi:MAG: hypothetical protein LW595_06685 [Rickettsiales bacterium]|nr:hypothetical protein [Rickettsiales bacterium]
MTKENLQEYIELLKHRISISTSKQEIKQFENLIKEAEKEKPKEGKTIEPTSKVIQINTTENLSNLITTALCEDGSVWRYANEKWACILEAPENKDEIEEITMFQGAEKELEDLCSFK